MEGTNDTLKEIERRLSLVERILSTSVITRRDVRLFFAIGIVTAIVCLGILISQIYIFNRVQNIYLLIAYEKAIPCKKINGQT